MKQKKLLCEEINKMKKIMELNEMSTPNLLYQGTIYVIFDPNNIKIINKKVI